jgi:outer membrane protein assembly factor BamB
MASPNISEALTTAIESRTGVLADNFSENNALLYKMKERGTLKPVSGGVDIRQELTYAENSTYKRYSGYELLNISPSDTFTSAVFDYKLASTAITISGLEMLQNSGPEQIIDLLESRVEVAEQSLMNNIASDMYSDGTADGGKQIGGLQLLVADSPSTGTVGGIDAATWAFWRNIAYDATTDGGTAATSANIQSYMNRVYVQLIRGKDKPDLIISDNNYYRLYMESLQTIQRVTNPKMADAGFPNIEYMGVPVVLDGGFGGGCPTNHMYFLNTKYIHFRPHRDRQFVPIGGERMSTNQDAIVKIIGWAGNMTVSNRRLQGVLKD